jgi:hypothetical protein
VGDSLANCHGDLATGTDLTDAQISPHQSN